MSDNLSSPKSKRRAASHPLDLSLHREPVLAILREIIAAPHALSTTAFNKLVRRHPRPDGGLYSRSELISVYRQLAGADGLPPFSEAIIERLRRKPVRTSSGVTPVTVLTKPFPCPGLCIFCPNDVRMPKSYLSDEPGAQRAEQNAFDPYLQTYTRLQTINIESTSAPAPVIDAFDDVIRAREDRQRTINQGMAYANAIIPEAQGQAQRLVEQGQGYRESVVAEARGQANRFNALLSQYQQSPAVMRERLYLDAIAEVFGSTPKVLVDVASDSPLMYLPLDQMGNGGSGTSSSGERLGEQGELDPRVLERLRSGQTGTSSSSNSGIRREGR